jgi:hypothetical protein
MRSPHIAFLALAVAACSSSSNGGTPQSSDGGPPADADANVVVPPPSGDGGSHGCAAGALFPTSAPGLVAALASDGTTVFFTTYPDPRSGGTTGVRYLESVPVAGGTPTQLASGMVGTELASLAVDGNDVFYFMDGYMRSLAKSGAGTPTELAMRASQFDMDATSLFFGGAGVFSVAKTGGMPSTVFTEASGTDTIVALDADSAYYVKLPPFSFGTDAGKKAQTIEKVAKTGGAPITLATVDVSDLEGVAELRVGGGYVVYSTLSDITKTPLVMRIFSVPVGGAATPTKLFETQYDGPIFTVANGFVYYQDPAKDAIEKVAVAGGAAVTVPSTLSTNGAAQFTNDAANIYWSDHGCVFKAAL